MYAVTTPSRGFLHIFKMYCIAGYFRGGKFSRIELFPAFQGENFSRIVTDCKEYTLKSKHFEGKTFMDCFRFVKFAKIFPLENSPLYGILKLLNECVVCVCAVCICVCVW